MKIRLINPRDSHNLTVADGITKFVVNAQGETDNVPDWVLARLRDSSHEFEIVGPDPDEAGEGAGGDTGEPPAEITDERREELLALLDLSLDKLEPALAGLPHAELGLLMAAEKKGKKRKGALQLIREATKV